MVHSSFEVTKFPGPQCGHYTILRVEVALWHPGNTNRLLVCSFSVGKIKLNFQWKSLQLKNRNLTLTYKHSFSRFLKLLSFFYMLFREFCFVRCFLKQPISSLNDVPGAGSMAAVVTLTESVAWWPSVLTKAIFSQRATLHWPKPIYSQILPTLPHP